MIFTYCASKFSSPTCHREGEVSKNGTLNWGIPFLNHIIIVQMLMDFEHQAFQISFPFSYSCCLLLSAPYLTMTTKKNQINSPAMERVPLVVAGEGDL